MSYTVYGKGFVQFEGAPSGKKDEVLAWMKNRFPGLRAKAEYEEITDGVLFFSDANLDSTYDTDSDGEVYLVTD